MLGVVNKEWGQAELCSEVFWKRLNLSEASWAKKVSLSHLDLHATQPVVSASFAD